MIALLRRLLGLAPVCRWCRNDEHVEALCRDRECRSRTKRRAEVARVFATWKGT